MDERPQHLALGLQLDEGELDALVGGERLAERRSLLRVAHGLVDAELGRPQRGGRLADAILVEELLDDLQAAPLATEDRRVRHPHVGESDVGVIGRHVERPQVLEHLEARAVGGHEEAGDALTVAGLAGRASEDQVGLRLVDAGVPRLLAVDHPLVAVADRGGLHVGGVGAVIGLGDAERESGAGVEQVVVPVGLLLRRAVLEHQQQPDVVADDRVLVLEVVVQAEALAGEVLADDRHAEVRAVAPAELGGERVVEVPGLDRHLLGPGEQPLPLLVGQAPAFPVGAGVLAAMVEEADVVVGAFDGDDHRLDEIVELGQIVDQPLG